MTEKRPIAPINAAERKNIPLCTGVLDYFPDALLAVAALSKVGNDQHNSGQPLHWAREKSTDHADCVARHLLDRGTIDVDNVRHSVKCAWRALALAQTEIEAAREAEREVEAEKKRNRTFLLMHPPEIMADGN